MTYSDQALHEISRNPVRLRAYYWHMEKHWRRLAREYRTRSQGQAQLVVGDTYERGSDLLDQALHMERCADFIRDHGNADLFVRSTLEPEQCTCRTHGATIALNPAPARDEQQASDKAAEKRGGNLKLD
jgi:hypothetical protein